MTNKEFYFDKLLPVALENACGRLHRIVYGESCFEKKECRDCEFYTVENIEKWLNAEHVEPEPPLLENGDSLKPGDLIMVKDADETKWAKKRFLTFADGWFHCFKNGKDYFELEGEFICYKQARLPMEGE